MTSIGDSIKQFLAESGQINPYEAEVKRCKKELALLEWKCRVFDRLRLCGCDLGKQSIKAVVDLADFEMIGRYTGAYEAEMLEAELNNIMR